jgi:integrase/recombinase XerD
MTALAPYLTTFLREHLPHERKASPHTCAAYAYSFQLLLCFAAARLKVKPSPLEIEQLDVSLVLAFLKDLESERRNSAHLAPFAATWRSWWYCVIRARRPKPA